MIEETPEKNDAANAVPEVNTQLADIEAVAALEVEADEERLQLVVPEGVSRERADKVLAREFTDWSRGQIQEAFADGEVLLNGSAIKKGARVSAGDVLLFRLPEHALESIEPIEVPLSIIYEDSHIIVINKHAGIVTHPGKNTGTTLVHALLHHTGGALATAPGDIRQGVVHRLDKDTTGVMVFAKSNEAYFQLVKLFAGREVQKEYLALVLGVPRLDSGTIKKPIDRHQVQRHKMAVAQEGKGRFAHTDWRVEKAFAKKYSMLRCWIHTGRTHQIRVHLSDLGHPLLGDATYGYKAVNDSLEPPAHVMLHAERLSFVHPVTGVEMAFQAPFFPEYEARLELLRTVSA